MKDFLDRSGIEHVDALARAGEELGAGRQPYRVSKDGPRMPMDTRS